MTITAKPAASDHAADLRSESLGKSLVIESLPYFDSDAEAKWEAMAAMVDQAVACDNPPAATKPNSPAATQPVLTVVIPVYNEPETVLQIVDRVRALPIDKEIIVVNDGSTDGTAKSLEKLTGLSGVEVIHHEVNRGKGAALQTGFSRARGSFVIIQDADLEYDPADILKVVAPLIAGEADVVYGSRYLERSEQDPSWLHRFGNWLLTTLSNVLTGYRLTDMETCYKAFRRDLLSQIKIEQPRFGFEPEITAKLARRRAQVKEVGVSYQSRGWDEGKKIGVKDLINTLYCIVRYAWF